MYQTTTLGAALALALSASSSIAAGGALEIHSPGATPSTPGPASYFVGDVQVSQRFQGSAPATVGGAVVAFAAGARTAWHTHPLGQTLYVLSGVGRVQIEGSPAREIRPGDIVSIPPGTKHWHGAAPDHAMSHLAFSEKLDGQSVTWLEQVDDLQYRAKVAN